MQKEEDKVCTFCATVIHYNQELCSGCKNYLTQSEKTVKTKEKELRIKTVLEEGEIAFSSHDRSVSGGCSAKRPDFVIPTVWGHIVVEVDEFQHRRKNYSCDCEMTRMKQIYYDIGETNVLFVRYNPDYYNPLREKVCEPKQREECLVKHIKKASEEGVEGFCILYLYYDGYDDDIQDMTKII